jgi:hypothetical protein
VVVVNLARAKRRWKAWDRYTRRIVKLCGGRCSVPDGFWDAREELAYWHNSVLFGLRRARRLNRRTWKGSRR